MSEQETTQEPPIADTPQNSESQAPTSAPEALEALEEEVISESNKEAPPKVDEIRVESGNEPKSIENQGLTNPAPTEPQNQAGTAQPQPQTAQVPVVEPLAQKASLARELLVKARNIFQIQKRKKLEKILTLFTKKTNITNDEVEKLLHCSDATATRYLSQLEKEGKIKQSGKTGQSVSYSKIS